MRNRNPVVVVYKRKKPSAPAHLQDCSRCPHIRTCWSHSVSNSHVATNLLICRIHTLQGRARDQAAKAFLEMMHPKVLDLVGKIYRKVRESKEVILADVQSMIMERLIRSYRIPSVGYALYYLFGPRGVVFYDVLAYLRNHGIDSRTVSLSSVFNEEQPYEVEDEVTPSPEEACAAQETRAELDRCLAVIDDGRTLSASEYRVLRFVLSSGDESSRGLTEIARRMGVKRQDAVKIFDRATARVREAMA